MPPKLASPIFVLAHGEPPSRPLAQALSRKSVGVLCTDGSYTTALKLGLKPRWVIGDMDSLPEKQTIARGTLAVFDNDQDASDFEKALKFLIKFGCEQAYVAGAEGGRTDHFLTALSVALKYAAKIKLTFYSDGGTIELVNKIHAFKARKGEIFSLIPVDNPSWASVSGARYEMKREPLFAGSRGQSNAAAGGFVKLEIHSGKVWLIRNCLPPRR